MLSKINLMKIITIKVAIVFSLAFVCSNFNAIAQQEQILGFTTELWQSNLTNPALLPEKKINIMIGSGYVNAKSDFALNDFIKVDPGTGRRQLIDTLVLGKLNNSNKINGNFNVQTLGISFPLGSNLRVSLHQAFVGEAAGDLSGDLARILYRGNTQFNGRTVSLGSSLNGDTHSELALGLAYTFSAFTIGARIKYLAGSQATFTPNTRANISVDVNAVQLKADADFKMITFGFSGKDGLSVPSLSSNNSGYAFDIGGAFTLGKLKLSASILDIGASINWKDDPRTFAASTNTTYSGADISNFFQTTNYTSNSYADTLKKYFNYTDTRTGTYTQNLPLRIYVSGTYQLTDAWRVGALIYNETGGYISSSSALSFDVTRKFGNIFTLGATVAYRNNSVTNIGLHGTLKLGPVQIYGMTDNIGSVVNYLNSKTYNARVGLNLIF